MNNARLLPNKSRYFKKNKLQKNKQNHAKVKTKNNTELPFYSKIHRLYFIITWA